MALSVSTGTTKGRSNDVWGAREVTLLTVTFDDDYLEGGELFNPKAFGHQGNIDKVLCFPRSHARGAQVAYVPSATAASRKLRVFGKADGTRTYDELCHCDLSALVVDVVVLSE
jgi:hypothetical protein